MKPILIIAAFTCGQWHNDAEQIHLRKFWPPSVEFPAGGKFYTLPQAYQIASNLGVGVHSPTYNIAALPDPGKSRSQTPGNANREFPWGAPAGLHAAKGWRSYKVASIPGPIRYWREVRAPFSGSAPNYVWEYPRGTIFAEMLLIDRPGDYSRCFEIRIRTKTDDGKWESTAFRPIASKEDASTLPGAKWVQRSIRDSSTPAIAGAASIDVELLDISSLDAETILSRPFAPSRIMMTASRDGAAVPRNYFGNVMQCTKCHQQTLTHVSVFDRQLPTPKREWYGATRGSDENFTFHIFDPSCISRNGATIPVVLNRNLNLERKR